MFLEFFKWWYDSGWRGAWRGAGKRINKVQESFAIPVLLKSLFAPWKRIVSNPGRSLDDKFRASIDNLVSRTVGFFVRLGTLIVATIIIILSGILGFVGAILWPILPLIFVYFLFRTIIG